MVSQLRSQGKASPLEYLFRIGIPIALIWGALKIYNMVAPTIIEAIENTWILIAIGTPLAFLLLYIISNPMLIWMGYKTLCRKITAFFIKMDPLSFMDRYADILSQKLANLNKIRINLHAKKQSLERKVRDLEDQVEKNLKLGQAALKVKDKSQASLAGTRAQGAKQSIALFTPNLKRMGLNLQFMDALAENWEISIIKLREEIDRKRVEYETLRDTAKALNQAEAFIKGDTEESRIYQESLRALEESVTQKIAYIEDFEKKSKDLMAGIAVEKQMQQDEGLDMLNQYMKDGKLFLPQDYSDLSPEYNWGQEIEFEEVKKPKTFGLLK